MPDNFLQFFLGKNPSKRGFEGTSSWRVMTTLSQSCYDTVCTCHRVDYSSGEVNGFGFTLNQPVRKTSWVTDLYNARMIVNIRYCSNILLRCRLVTCSVGYRTYYASSLSQLAMKPGTPIPGLDIYKEKDPPVALERSQYPEWLDSLMVPLPTLGQLRRMPDEDATDKDKKRYLKLLRKLKIKQKNEEKAAES